MNPVRTASSYGASAAGDSSPRATAAKAVSAASRPASTRVVHALERGDVDHAGAVAAQEEPRRVQPLRERVMATARDRLRAPLETLAAFEQRADLRMRLEPLQEIVRRQGGVAVVEADDHADAQHVVAHRVDERAPELAVLGLGTQRPPHRVDDAVERLRDLPHLLDPELPHLRVGATEVELVEGDAGEMTLGALGQHGHLGDDVGAGLEVGERITTAAPALVAGTHAHDAPVVHEQGLGRGLGQDHRPAVLGTRGQPAPEVGERDDHVAVISHGGRRRDRHRASASEEKDGLLGHRPVARHVGEHVVAEQRAERTRVDDRARQQV